MNSFKLYEIDAQVAAITESMIVIKDEETGEVEITDDALSDIEKLNMERDNIIENIALAIKNLTAEHTAIKVEEEALHKRRMLASNHADRLKNFLSNYIPGEKIETPRVKIGWRKSSVVHVQDEAGFIDWARKAHPELLSFKDPTISKTAVKDAISKGATLPGAEIVTNMNIQVK